MGHLKCDDIKWLLISTSDYIKRLSLYQKSYFVKIIIFSLILFQPQDAGFHGQEKVYGDLGEEMLEHSFEGKQYILLYVYNFLRLPMFYQPQNV